MLRAVAPFSAHLMSLDLHLVPGWTLLVQHSSLPLQFLLLSRLLRLRIFHHLPSQGNSLLPSSLLKQSEVQGLRQRVRAPFRCNDHRHTSCLVNYQP